MSTRATPFLPEHVNALNSIDMAFYDDKRIRDEWKIYLDHLHSYPANQEQNFAQEWENKRQGIFVELLYAISQYLKYEVSLKKGIYFPQAHGTWLLQQEQYRNGVIKLLNGENTLNVKIVQ